MDPTPVPHPNDQTLHAHRLGQLDDRSTESVEQHLASCRDCRRRAAELASSESVARRPSPRGQADSPPPVGSSFAGLSKQDGESHPATPLAAEALPSGLADNPDYEVISELGRGGMGVVYLAQNTLMGRKEVLKVVSGNLLDRSIVRERFLREIRSAAQLQHPNIVTAYSAVRAGDRIVLAMEYVEGYDLAKLVKAQGPLPVAHAANFTYQAALGLQHAHERGMVHRDIKPGNLILSRQGKRATVKVLDFGLAKATQEAPIDGGLTREGQMLGTPDYIAPEQSLDAQKADIRADIYSLGCTLYYLLAGAPPFEANSLYEILQAHHSRDALPLNLARPEVPAELAALVAKMMAKAPEHRFQTPSEVARALKPFFKPGETGPAAAESIPATSPSSAWPVAPGAVATASPPATPPALAVAASGTPASSTPPVVLVELEPEQDLSEARPNANSGRATASPWLWASAGAAAMLLFFGLAWKLGVDPGRTNDRPASGPVEASRPEPDHRRVETPPLKAAPVAREAPKPEPQTLSVMLNDHQLEKRDSPTSIPRKLVAPTSEPVAEAPKPPSEPTRRPASVEPKVVAIKPAPSQPPDMRRLVAIADLVRLPNPVAEQPVGAFWPALRPDDLAAWQVGDPDRIEMNRKGLFLSAGPGGNLFLTKRDDFKSCTLKITLSATKGTEAFLALRAHRDPDGPWEAITARIYDDGRRIGGGHQSADFALPDVGKAIDTADFGDPLHFTFQIDNKGKARLSVRRKTSSIDYAGKPAGRYAGAVGVFVRSGCLIIHSMDVQ